MDVCNLDIGLFRSVNGLAGRSAVLDAIGIFFASPLIYLMVAFVISLSWYHYATAHTGKSRHEAVRDITMMLRAAMAASIAIVGDFLFSLAYFRERPFTALQGVNRLIAEPLTSKSLPSDHTSMAFAIAVSVTLLHPRLGAAMLALAAGVGFSRIFVGVHYPTDVLAGMFVGVLAAVTARYVGRRLRDEKFIEAEIDLIRKFRKKRLI